MLRRPLIRLTRACLPRRLPAARPGRARESAGFSLVETMVAVAMLGFLLLAILSTIERGMVAAVKSREQLRASRIAQMIHSRSLSMDFYNTFACDSSKTNYNLQATYPERFHLAELQTAVRAAGFTHFTIDVTFMRRDSSDSNGNGMTSDLVEFRDTNNDGIDDYDPNIKFFDQNVDGDYYDSYMVGTRKVAEQPDTHIKLLTITVWKGGTARATKQGELLSAEQFSGIENPSSEASLQLNITFPENGSSLYRYLTAPQIAAQNLTILSAYPPDVLAYRADAGSALRLAGNTEPLGDVSFTLGSPAGAALDATPADMVGDFDFQSTLITNALVEGTNTLYAKTVKSTLSSPYALKEYVLDLNPPAISNQTPTATVKTLSPYIACRLTDVGSATATTPSGICDSVTSFFNGASTVPYSYIDSTGRVMWVSSTTQLPPTLADGTAYTVTVEGGDNAHYKVSATWTFTVNIDDTDNSPPTVSNRTPLGANAPTLPVISCRVFDGQSGINPSSLVMTVDGTVVVSSAVTPVMGDYWDPETETVRYTPTAAFANSSFHTVTIHAEHWSVDPPDPDKRYLDPLYDVNASWDFTVTP